MTDNKCSDCTNSKGCTNCEDGNMHEVKKKEPEGALKELLDNIDPVEYEKVRQEMLGYGFTIIDNITHTQYNTNQLIDNFKNFMKE